MKPHSTKGDILKASCPSREVLDLIADKWTVLIIYTLAGKTFRNNELARSLGDISQKVLTQCLRKLERNGLVKREIFPVVPPHVEYALTPLGRSLTQVLGSMTQWTEKHFPEVNAARTKFDKQDKG